MMRYGRKFGLAVLGIGCVMALTVLGFVVALLETTLAGFVGALLPVAIGAVAGVVATFITGNSAVTFAYARNDDRLDTRQVTERRDADLGLEPSP